MVSLRRFLIGLALVVSLGLSWWAKAAASWRPVAMGEVAVQKDDTEYLETSEHRVLSTGFCYLGASGVGFYSTMRMHCLLFDTRDDHILSFPFSRQHATGLEGDNFWNISWHDDKKGGTVSIEYANKRFSFNSPQITYVPRVASIFRVVTGENRAIFLCQGHIYNWDLQTARLESDIQYQDPTLINSMAALSRDARTFVAFDIEGLRIGDVRTGKIQKKVPFQGFRFFESVHFSPYGQYALCERPTDPSQMRVVDVGSGKSLWVFDNPDNTDNDWTISDDEQTIFVRRDKEWEVRDLKTGGVQRRLPVIPGISAVAPSPDGATLYSVANGVLYRQRAR